MDTSRYLCPACVFFDGYLDIHIQGIETTIEPVETETGKAALAETGNFRLGDAQQLCGFLLFHATIPDPIVDLTRQFRFRQTFIAIRQT